MKVKRLLSKLGIIAICLVMGACSVVGSSAAEAGSEVSSVGSGYSEGTGRRDIVLETTGQRLSCKKGTATITVRLYNGKTSSVKIKVV